MNNKANISTFIFVMLVLVTCIVAAGYFLSSSKNLIKEVSDVSNTVNITLAKEKANFYLQEISHEAIVKSYSETIQDLSSNEKFSYNGNILSVSVLSGSFAQNEDKYKANFVFHLKNNLATIANSYSFLNENEQIKNLLNNPEINFDGDNIEIILKGYNLLILGSQVNSTFLGDLSYKTDLEKEGLIRMSSFYEVSSLCSSADKKCIQDNIFNFDIMDNGIMSVSSDSGNHFLVHVISKEDFLVSGNSLRPELYVII